MNQRNLAIVSAGLGQPSSTRLLADRLVAASDRALREGGVEPMIEIVELRDHTHDLANHLLTGFAGEGLRKAIDTVVEAHGLIVVTPIFNASYSGLFKTFFDVLETGSLAAKPVLIAATAGTARHSLALEHAVRPLFAYLKSVVVPTAVFAASEDWGSGGTSEEPALSDRIDMAARELADLVMRRVPGQVDDPYLSPTPFTDLLGNSHSGAEIST